MKPWSCPPTGLVYEGTAVIAETKAAAFHIGFRPLKFR